MLVEMNWAGVAGLIWKKVQTIPGTTTNQDMEKRKNKFAAPSCINVIEIISWPCVMMDDDQ